MQISRSMDRRIRTPESGFAWAERGVRVASILALAWLFTRIARRLLATAAELHHPHDGPPA